MKRFYKVSYKDTTGHIEFALFSTKPAAEKFFYDLKSTGMEEVKMYFKQVIVNL